MKKILASLLILFVFAITVPLSVEAHNGCPRHRKARSSNVRRNYKGRTTRPVYYETRGYSYQRPTFYQRHRNLINIGLGAGGGALVGGLLKGKRGAGYGALIGAGSGALYTYVLKPKKKRVYR
ncbi:MAG: hypothetical protein M3Q33_06240 [Acidobacteriota bacterium]|nr:hypothetical protein [Acidobacteriota bacterium]